MFATHIETGRMGRKPKQGREWLQVQIPSELKKRIKIAAAREETTMAELVIKILDEQVSKD